MKNAIAKISRAFAKGKSAKSGTVRTDGWNLFVGSSRVVNRTTQGQVWVSYDGEPSAEKTIAINAALAATGKKERAKVRAGRTYLGKFEIHSRKFSQAE